MQILSRKYKKIIKRMYLGIPILIFIVIFNFRPQLTRMCENDEWIIDTTDLEGKFTSAKNGSFTMHYTEEGADSNISGSYTLDGDHLTLMYELEGEQITLYYERM